MFTARNRSFVGSLNFIEVERVGASGTPVHLALQPLPSLHFCLRLSFLGLPYGSRFTRWLTLPFWALGP